MTLQELQEYLRQLSEAEYVRGTGFVVVVDGQQQVFDGEQLVAEQKRVEAEIGRLAGPNAAQRAIAAVGRGLRTTEEEAAAKQRKASLTAGLAKSAKQFDDLVAAYRKAEFELGDTARLIQRGAANRKPSDLPVFEARLAEAEQALNRQGLFVAENGAIVRRTDSGRSTVVQRPAATGQPTGVTQRAPREGARVADRAEAAVRVGPTVGVPVDRLVPEAGGTTATTGAGETGASSTITTGGTAGGTAGAGSTTGGTAAGTTGGGMAGGTAGAVTPAQRRERRQADLAAALQQFFPGYTAEWLTENGEAHFGKDLIDLFRKIADPRNGYDTTTAAGRERIQAEIRGTTYWQTTVTAAKNFDSLTAVDQENTVARTKQRLAATYGDISLDDQTLTDLARMVARNGLTGLGEQQAVYTTVFRVRQQRPEQATRALEGAQADRIRALGRAYNFRVSDAQVQAILTGEPEVGTGLVLTEDGLRQRLQKYVKGVMPQLAEQIDAGLTLEDIGANYRRYAARLLERSEDEIDMFEGPFLDAFGDGESGQLSLGAWSEKVKSDPRFGWQFTNQANQLAGDIALTIARAFGKVQ